MRSQAFLLYRKYNWNEHNVCTNPLVFDFGHDKRCHCRISLAEDEIYVRLGYDYGYGTDTTDLGHSSALPSKAEHSHPYPTPLAAVTAGLSAAIEFFSKKPAAKFVASLKAQLKNIEQSMQLPQPTQESIMQQTVIEAETKEQPVEYKCVDCGEIFTSPNDFAHKCAGDGEFSDDHEFVEVPCRKNLPQEVVHAGTPETTTPPMAAVARAAAVFVPEPENLLPVKRNTGLKCCTVQQQLTCQQLEVAIQNQLSQEDNHTRAAGVAALRAGVLFHYYKQSLDGKRNDFWALCEVKFKVNRATISRKMRLAVIWAKEKGADEAALLALANAIDLNDDENPAIQLAFDFVGDQTTTELYRKHKLVGTGPVGGDNTPRDPDTGKPIRAPRRTKSAMDKDGFTKIAQMNMLQLTGAVNQALNQTLDTPEGRLNTWSHLDSEITGTKELDTLINNLSDLLEQLRETQSLRKRLARK